MNELARAFLSELPTEWQTGSSDEAAVERALAHGFAVAHAAWPGIAIADADLLRLIAEHVARGDRTASVENLLADVAFADLYVACACSSGSTAALRAFEDRYFASIGAVLARIGANADAADEVRQIVREKLFVGRDGQRPRVLDLAGHGDLGALVRIVALRSALNLRRSNHRLELVEHPSLISDLVLGDESRQQVKQLERGQVERALEDAIADLDARDRNVLRMNLLHGLSIDEIGRVHAVHRATVARWIERIRDQLRDGTVRRLREQLALSTDEVESLIRFVHSRIEVSFTRLLD